MEQRRLPFIEGIPPKRTYLDYLPIPHQTIKFIKNTLEAYQKSQEDLAQFILEDGTPGICKPLLYNEFNEDRKLQIPISYSQGFFSPDYHNAMLFDSSMNSTPYDWSEKVLFPDAMKDVTNYVEQQNSNFSTKISAIQERVETTKNSLPAQASDQEHIRAKCVLNKYTDLESVNSYGTLKLKPLCGTASTIDFSGTFETESEFYGERLTFILDNISINFDDMDQSKIRHFEPKLAKDPRYQKALIASVQEFSKENIYRIRELRTSYAFFDQAKHDGLIMEFNKITPYLQEKLSSMADDHEHAKLYHDIAPPSLKPTERVR